MSISSEEQQRPDSLIDRDQGRKYWGGVDADDNGMLGGFPEVSRADLQGSRSFLAKMGIGVRNQRRRVTRVLEGGAGPRGGNSIGRITRGLLLPIADTVDIIEPITKFTAALQNVPGVGRVSNVGMEEWKPEEGIQYDLIWIQWCVGHLTDDQLEGYLRLCAAVLEPERGLVIVKENLATKGADHYDETDSTVTRQNSSFVAIFKRAGLKIVRMEMQKELKVEGGIAMLPVKMYALRPRSLTLRAKSYDL